MTTSVRKCIYVSLQIFAVIQICLVCLYVQNLALVDYLSNAFNSNQKYENQPKCMHGTHSHKNLKIGPAFNAVTIFGVRLRTKQVKVFNLRENILLHPLSFLFGDDLVYDCRRVLPKGYQLPSQDCTERAGITSPVHTQGPANRKPQEKRRNVMHSK